MENQSAFAVKVAKAFFDYFGIDGGIDIRLKKHIPCGSGLGGGSSNGAAVLKGLCRLYGISLSPGQKVKLTENIRLVIKKFRFLSKKIIRAMKLLQTRRKNGKGNILPKLSGTDWKWN